MEAMSNSKKTLDEGEVPSKRKRITQPSCSSSQDYTLTLDESELNWAGRVERLQMSNFMCHSNLELTFNPRVNFISGKNGSGKSAVMAALVVVLGGTASNTGRATGVADFIKKGENAGRVTIVLINEGINAYKPDIYGNRISITRNFARASGSTYIIKSGSGAIISRKREEIDRIRDSLQLQIKNPICVLNQDVARNFLSSADSKVRFNLFMEATQLRTLLDKYSETAGNLHHAQEDLNRKKHLLDEAEKEVDALTERLKYIFSLEKHVLKRAKLEEELVWAGVIADENALSDMKAEIGTLEAKMEEIRQAVSSHQDLLDDLEEQIQEAKENMEKTMQSKRGIAESKRELYSEMMNVEKEVTSLERQISVLQPKQRRTQDSVQKIQEYMEQIDESVSRSAEEAARCQARMQELLTDLRELKDKTAQAERDLDNANETRIRDNEELQSAARLVRDMQRSLEHKKTQMEGMRGRDDVELIRYGNYVPNLLKEIEIADKRRRFKKRPVGPLGMHVKLNCDSKWSSAIESAIGSLLTSFCCDNRDDYKVLSELIQKCVGPRSPIIIVSKFVGRHNLGNRRVRVPGYKTILDCLTFTNDTAFNTLIDQAHIERVLLFETDLQAIAMLSSVENVPKGLSMGITLACDRYRPAPSYATYRGNPSPPRFFNTTNREDVVKKLEIEIRSLEAEMAEYVSKQNTLQKNIEKIKAFARRAQEKLQEYRENRVRLERELSELKDQEQSRPVPRTKQALEEELEVLKKEEEKCTAEIAKLQAVLDATLMRKTEATTKYDAANREIAGIQEEISKLEATLEKKKEAIKTHNARMKNADTQLNNLTAQVASLKEQEVRATVELEKRTEEAVAFCPRIDTNRPPAEVQRNLSKEEQYLKAAEKISGSKEDAIAEYKMKKERYEEVKRSQQTIAELINFWKFSLKTRRDLYNIKRKHTAQTVSNVFRASLLTRGYEGMAQFNFDDCRLELEVHPHRGNDDSRKDSRTLSGGERSYSTVSFILAIWRTVRMPFYFMDEFDVFMDKVNRKVIMDLLLQNASESLGRQYVFITPQDISNVIASDAISIYKMPDPERKRLSN